MSNLGKIKEEIKPEVIDISDDFFLHHDESFVDSSKSLDHGCVDTIGNFSTEEDPLSLPAISNAFSEVYYKKRFLVPKSGENVGNSSISGTNPNINEIDCNIFLCSVCKKENLKQKRVDYINTDHTYAKLQNFVEIGKIRRARPEKHYCKFCRNFCQSAGLYILHLLKHGTKPYDCNICYQQWPVYTYLRPHVQFDEYPCDLCGKSLINKNSYIVHMSKHYQRQRRVHKRETLL